MSGIAGIYHPGGRPVAHADLQRMIDVLAHRGPDGSAVWVDGNIGLGHRMLWTTPESLRETLPRTNRRGDLTITADARIDNRDELLPLLGLNDRPAVDVSDSDVILAAYERWGAACPDRLLGDFAFAIWDARRQQLFCARDHFGIKPFLYAWSGGVFVFGSELKAIIALDELPHAPDEAAVARYLAALITDKTSTWYPQVQRLAPAHSLTIDTDGLHIARYWDFDPAREIHLGSDAEYAAAFRELFTQAVDCRMRSALPAGAFLSGGLDSSSVACVARDLQAARGAGPLATFSAVYDELAECDERRYINAVLAQPGFTPHAVHGDRAELVAEVAHILPFEDEPFFAPGLFVTCELYRSIRQHGVRVVLDGHGGDETVSRGIGYMRELAIAGRWRTFAREAQAISKLEDVSFAALAWSYVRRYGLGPWLRSLPGFGVARSIRQTLQGRAHGPQPDAEQQAAWSMFINPELIERVGLRAQYQRWQHSAHPFATTERERHHQDLTGAMQPYAFEVIDRAAAAYGIEPRYPLWDKRLVEFCLALPGRQKLHKGWDRYVLRNAMRNILPPDVQWRADKTNFVANISRALFTADRARIEALLLDPPDCLTAYANIAAIQQSYLRYRAQPEQCPPHELFALVRVVCLALWLRGRSAAAASFNQYSVTSLMVGDPASALS